MGKGLIAVPNRLSRHIPIKRPENVIEILETSVSRGQFFKLNLSMLATTITTIISVQFLKLNDRESSNNSLMVGRINGHRD